MTAEDYDRHLLGHSDREIVEKACEITGIDAPVDPLLELRKRRYRELVAHHNPITAETAALVRVLAEHDVPMAIVTGAQRDDVRAVLESSPVGEVITVVVAEEDVRRGKPDPEGFLAGAAALGPSARRHGGVRGLGARGARRAGRGHALHRRRRATQPGGADGGAGRGAAPVTRSRLARAAGAARFRTPVTSPPGPGCHGHPRT